MNDEQTENVNETSGIGKLPLNVVLSRDASVESIKEYVAQYSHFPFFQFAITNEQFAVALKNSVYLYSYQSRTLAQFIKILKKAGFRCNIHNYQADLLFDNCEDVKIIVVIGHDFNKKDTYTVFFAQNIVYEDFSSCLNNDTPEENIKVNQLYFIYNTPIFKYSTLPVNIYSNYAPVNSVLSRFSSASWFENVRKKTILVAGIGGIGSWTAMLLSRMHPENIIMYDNDIVENGNMSGQLYSKNNIGLPKVVAMSDNIYSFSDYSAVVEKNERFYNYTSPCDIMISGFDNMNSRKIFYDVWKKHVMSKPEEERGNCLLIDGRLAAETFQVYCITGDDTVAMKTYESIALFSEYEADSTICSYKQISYMANMIAGTIVNLFTNFCANDAADAPVRSLPYYTEYEGALMEFKTIKL